MIGFLYIILFLVSIMVLILYIKKGVNVLWIVFFSVFVLYYVFVPTFLNVSNISEWETVPHSTFIDVFLDATQEDLYRTFLITLFALITMIIAHWIIKRIKIIGISKPGSYSNETEENYKYINKVVYYLGVVLLIIGGLALIKVMVELGGLKRMLIMGNNIRDYTSNNADFVSPLGAVCITLSVCVTGSFFCIYSSGEKKKKHIFLLVVSFIFSVIYLMFNAGRAPLIVFIACIGLSFFKERGKSITWIVVLGVIFILFFSSSLSDVMLNLSRGLFPFHDFSYSFVDNLSATLTDYSFPYANVIELPQMISKYGYRNGIDYILWAYELIPKRLLSLSPMTTVTAEVSQYYVQEGLSIAGTPADFITFGWFEGNVIGIIVNCIVVYCVLNVFYKKLRILPVRYSAFKYRMCFFAYSLITSNDIVLVVKSNLYLIVIMIVIAIAINRSRKKLAK